MTLRVMDYKATLNLPKTAFPMKANLPKTEARCSPGGNRSESTSAFARPRPAAPWILHDGPPYANGHIHLGTMLNKVLKDVIVKSRSMSGFNAVYVPGWGCHGLPIEHQVDKELGLDKAGIDVRNAMDPVEKREMPRIRATSSTSSAASSSAWACSATGTTRTSRWTRRTRRSSRASSAASSAGGSSTRG